jgi:hypothetical protein
MHRITSALLVGCGLLLTTWALAPAAPSPARPPLSAADQAALNQTTPVLADVNAQVDRLRERLASAPQFPAPSRDPFRFGPRPEPAHPTVEPAAPPAILAPPPAPAPVLPRLVAVMTTEVEGGTQRTAVVSVGDDVQMLRIGQSVGKFIVRSIGEDAVELVDQLTGATFRISLR